MPNETGKYAVIDQSWLLTLCAQDSPVHWTIQGLSSCLIKHCLFANLICQLKQTRWYWVPVSGYSWRSRSICWPIVEVPVQRRILGTLSWHIHHCIFTNPIWQSKQIWRYWVHGSKYETLAYIFVTKLQLLLAYHWSSGTPLIRIPKSRKLRHRSANLGSNATLAARAFLAYDWRSFTTEIFNPVQNEVLGCVCRQLWQAASHYGCYYSSPGTFQKRKISHREVLPCSTYCTLYIVVYFILIMFSSTLN